MQGADLPDRHPKTLYTFNSRTDIDQFAVGCDADVGGLSSVHLDLDESTRESNGENQPKAIGKFWGVMNLGVKPGLGGKIRGGYAGFRNKVPFPLPCSFFFRFTNSNPMTIASSDLDRQHD